MSFYVITAAGNEKNEMKKIKILMGEKKHFVLCKRKSYRSEVWVNYYFKPVKH